MDYLGISLNFYSNIKKDPMIESFDKKFNIELELQTTKKHLGTF